VNISNENPEDGRSIDRGKVNISLIKKNCHNLFGEPGGRGNQECKISNRINNLFLKSIP
jgi:hypothetical protein